MSTYVADAPGTPARAASATPVRGSRTWLAGAALALLGALLGGVLVGPAGLPPAGILADLASHLPLLHVHSGLSATDHAILWQLRMPRVVLGGIVGWTLASSGAAYQGAFRNPLADPYLLGAAAGAGLGATLVIAYAPATSGWPVDPLPLAAFGGAIGAVVITYVIATTADRRTSSAATILLAGIALTAFLTSIQTFVQQRHTEDLRPVYTWILGRLSTAGWHDVLLILPYSAVGSAGLLLHRRVLDVLRVGDDEASTLGVDARRARLLLVGFATLGTAAAVAVSGLIGFVGIIVPHAVRLTAGTSYRRIIPLSMLLGGAFLICADVLARAVASPAEIPIGVITAFFGAPFFLVVLRRRSRP